MPYADAASAIAARHCYAAFMMMLHTLLPLLLPAADAYVAAAIMPL